MTEDKHGQCRGLDCRRLELYSNLFSLRVHVSFLIAVLKRRLGGCLVGSLRGGGGPFCLEYAFCNHLFYLFARAADPLGPRALAAVPSASRRRPL